LDCVGTKRRSVLTEGSAYDAPAGKQIIERHFELAPALRVRKISGLLSGAIGVVCGTRKQVRLASISS
jgi:hypothetical protein